MNWMDKDEGKLLHKAFLFGIGGIIACMVPLFNSYGRFWENVNINIFTGIGIGVQLFSLSILVLILRKRKITHETKGKAQRMIIALTVSLLFFFMI